MIDGVKIQVPSHTANKWLSNKKLSFYTSASVQSGELLDGNLIAQYKGLKFFITQSQTHENKVYCSVRGSLHKYHNKGKHNANDFTINQLGEVLQDLNKNFSIDPQTAILQNIEYGVNILSPVTATEVLKSLVSYKNYSFSTLRVERKAVGKIIELQRKALKVYDKGKQHKTKDKNLLRVELAVKKMEAIKKLDIKTLHDLTDTEKLDGLGQMLLSWWAEIIYYDKSINIKHLSNFEQKKLLYYATPRNWTEFNRKQRHKAKQHFNKLMACYGSSTQNDIYNLLAEKCKYQTAQKGERINHYSKDLLQHQKGNELTVRIHGYNVPKTTKETTNKKRSKKGQFSTPVFEPKNKCRSCGSDISNKQKKALYCSKACNNKINGMKRTKRRQTKIAHEKKSLEKLIKKSESKNFELLISYKTNSGTYTDFLTQTEIHTTPEWIRKVFEVVVYYRKNANPITLTSYRSRRLIKHINNLNI